MRFAYTAIVNERGYSIGRADEGTLGYTPVPEAGNFPTYEAARKHAEAMNVKAGVDLKEATLIVLGTMRSGCSGGFYS